MVPVFLVKYKRSKHKDGMPLCRCSRNGHVAGGRQRSVLDAADEFNDEMEKKDG